MDSCTHLFITNLITQSDEHQSLVHKPVDYEP